MTSEDIEERWLSLTHKIASAEDGRCICSPSQSGVRWSGYLGRDYWRKRVLFVGANHNGGVNGLLKTPEMSAYNSALLSWSARKRSDIGDRQLLELMRRSYLDSWPQWGAVWNIFLSLRQHLAIKDEEFAFCNLARCPDPIGGLEWDNSAILACQETFSLSELVEAIDARIIFIAKAGSVGKSVQISDEVTLNAAAIPSTRIKRLVIRYGNGSRGIREKRHWTRWIPHEAPQIKAFLQPFADEL